MFRVCWQCYFLPQCQRTLYPVNGVWNYARNLNCVTVDWKLQMPIPRRKKVIVKFLLTQSEACELNIYINWKRQLTWVGSTCWPQCRCENEMIGALFGKIGDSVWNTIWSQSTDTAPCCDLPPNASTLHRHGNRSAVLNSGHGCQVKTSPYIWWTSSIHSQNIRNVWVCHLFDIILVGWRLEKWKKRNRKTHFLNCCASYCGI